MNPRFSHTNLKASSTGQIGSGVLSSADPAYIDIGVRASGSGVFVAAVQAVTIVVVHVGVRYGLACISAREELQTKQGARHTQRLCTARAHGTLSWATAAASSPPTNATVRSHTADTKGRRRSGRGRMTNDDQCNPTPAACIWATRSTQTHQPAAKYHVRFGP